MYLILVLKLANWSVGIIWLLRDQSNGYVDYEKRGKTVKKGYVHYFLSCILYLYLSVNPPIISLIFKTNEKLFEPSISKSIFKMISASINKKNPYEKKHN